MRSCLWDRQPRHEREETNQHRLRRTESLTLVLAAASFHTDLTRIVGVRHETVRQAQEWKDSVLASRNAAISQLTNCLNKYQRLGLHFERRAYDQHHNDKDLTKSSDDAKEALQFWFTLLDANDPDRAFPFTLRCDEATDAYQVLDCDALLDSKIVQQLVMELNETDDMTTFIAQMRHAFLQALKSLPPAAQ